MKTLYPFYENLNQKNFHNLQITYWDNLEKLNENYNKLSQLIVDNESKNELEKQNFINLELLVKSYKILIEEEHRRNYLLFLKYNYFLAEPLTLHQLHKNYYNKIFPFFIFSIYIKLKQCLLTVNFVSKKLTINTKDQVYCIEPNKLITVNKKFGTSIIIMIENTQKNDNEKNEFIEIEFLPEISQQLDIIYTIISFFAKGGIQDNNFYELLEDDTYMPSGIILRAKVSGTKIKSSVKDDKYAILGPSMIIIFKDESVETINNILPILPLFMQIIYCEKENKIIFKYLSREYPIYFYEKNLFNFWKTTLKSICNKRMKCRIGDIELFEINERKKDENVIKELDIEIQCVQEEKNAINNKLETMEKLFNTKKE